MTPERLAQVDDALREVRSRIASAARAADRDPAEVTLVAVTKTFPVSDVQVLADLGVLDVGENKVQEAQHKSRDLATTPAGEQPSPAVRFHLIGQLQSNKARPAASFAAAVHSVDRLKIVHALDRAARDERTAPLPVFLQVSLDGDPGRGGAVAADVPALADAVAAATGLTLAGVMTVAPVGWEPARAFADLADVSTVLRRDHPGATSVSAGMSGDFEAAIAAGSTHVRVGSALLGSRPPQLS